MPTYIAFAIKTPEHYLLMFENPPWPICQTTWVKRIPHLRFLLAALQRGFHEGVFRPRERYSQMEMAYAAWTVAHQIAMLRPTYRPTFPLTLTRPIPKPCAPFASGLMVGNFSSHTEHRSDYNYCLEGQHE
jgi:hypothetical protein